MFSQLLWTTVFENKIAYHHYCIFFEVSIRALFRHKNLQIVQNCVLVNIDDFTSIIEYKLHFKIKKNNFFSKS